MNSKIPNLAPKSHLIGSYAPIDLLKYAGLVTWVAVAIPLLFHYWIYPNPQPVGVLVLWGALQLAFGAAYWYQARLLPVRSSVRQSLVLLVLMVTSALLISYLSQTALGAILLLIVAGMLPWMLSFSNGLIWLIGQNIVLAGVISLIPGVSPGNAVLLSVIFLSVSILAFITSLVGLRNIRARNELATVNSELLSTQRLLAENTRIAERVRIARELHDLVGHHLTALTLNLEVVTHMVEGKTLQHVQQAHSLAKLLLADVREVVSEMRNDDRVDLQQVLETLTLGVPEPKVQLQLPEQLVITDPNHAQILLRCVQEIVTNSARHARARNLWVKIDIDENAIKLTAKDDGRGTKAINMGNGLSGMAERVEQLDGTLLIQSEPGEGFELTVTIPKEKQ